MVSRRARPMVALARWPEPRTAVPLWMPSRPAMGPLTMTTGVAPPVVVVMALRLRGDEAPKAVDTGCALVTKENVDTPEIKKVLGQ